jgi:hypothetical protein
MHEATKIVSVDGVNYQLRRMTPLVGGYIWQRLMAALYKAQEGRKQEPEPTVEDASKPKPSAEERMRAMCGVAFLFLSFEDFQFVQKHCMQVLMREEPVAGFLPVQMDDGRWASKEVEANPLLVTKLMVEALVFSLHPFLA